MKKENNEKTKRTTQVAYVHGRIEAEIERFSGAMGISPMELTTRLVELLLPQGQRSADHMSFVQQTPARGRVSVAAMEMVKQPYSRGTQSTKSKGSSKISAYWQKMTPEQRSREVKRRMSKWSPEAKKKWKYK